VDWNIDMAVFILQIWKELLALTLARKIDKGGGLADSGR